MEKETNILQAGLFLQNLKPGKYSVLIAKEGYWPWFKELEIKEQFVTEARALILPKEPEGKVLLKENLSPAEISKYGEVTAIFKKLNSAPANEAMERFANHDRQKLWWKPGENKIWVEWIDEEKSRPYYINENKVLVLDSVFTVRNADFYPGRYDVIIAAVQNGIFAIEIDARGGRTLQPIYKGKKPNFIIYKNDPSVYILEEKTLIKIEL